MCIFFRSYCQSCRHASNLNFCSGRLYRAIYLTLCIWETHERVFRQTVKTQMECCIISVSTLFAKTKMISSEREIQFQLEIITVDPSIFKMYYPKFIVSYQVEEPICSIQRVNVPKMLLCYLHTCLSVDL